MIFLFYIKARPELSDVPINRSDVYTRGYCLEHLRDLTLTDLHTTEAQHGHSFDKTHWTPSCVCARPPRADRAAAGFMIKARSFFRAAQRPGRSFVRGPQSFTVSLDLQWRTGRRLPER